MLQSKLNSPSQMRRDMKSINCLLLGRGEAMTPSVKLVAAANQTDQTGYSGQCRDPRQTWPPRIAGDSIVMTLAGSFAQGPE